MFPSSFVITLRSFFFIHVINFATTLNPEVTIPNVIALIFYSYFIYNFTSDMRTFQPSDKFYFKKCYITSLHYFTSVTILRSFFFIHVTNFATASNPGVAISDENAIFSILLLSTILRQICVPFNHQTNSISRNVIFALCINLHPSLLTVRLCHF